MCLRYLVVNVELTILIIQLKFRNQSLQNCRPFHVSRLNILLTRNGTKVASPPPSTTAREESACACEKTEIGDKHIRGKLIARQKTLK